MGQGRRASWLLARSFRGVVGACLSGAFVLIVTPSAFAQPPSPSMPQTTPTPGVPSPAQTRPGIPRRDPILPGAEPGTGVIRGRILALDSGMPLRRVQVRLQGGNLRQGRATLTDAQGQFEFKDLGAGRYTLSASKGGYVSLQYGQRGPADTGRMVDVANGQTLPRLDIALPRGAVVTGRVVDEAGEPIADVPVAALQYRMFNGRRRLIPSTRTAMTNDIGQYRLYGLPPGEYYLSVANRMGMMMTDAQSDDPSGYAPTFYPGTSNIAEAQRLNVGVGEELTADVQLTPTRLVRISGTVVDSSGKPPTSGFIVLQNRSADAAGPMMTGGGTAVRPDGTFQLAGVAPGTYNVITNINLDPSGGDSREVANVPVTVSGQDITDLRVATTKGIVLSGHITFEGTADATTAKQIHPICMPVDVEAGMMAAGQPMPPDEQGQFQIKGITSKCLINAFAGQFGGGQPTWMVKHVMLNGTDITDRPIEPAGKPIGGIEITMTNRTATIDGSVQDAQNQPSKEYTVIVFPEDRDKWQPELMQRYLKRARPDQSGVFKVIGLPAGKYLVVAFDTIEQGAEGDPEFLAKIQSIATKVEVSDGGTQSVSLKLLAPPAGR